MLLWAELSSEYLEVRDPDSGAELVIYSMMKQREVTRRKPALRQGPSFRKNPGPETLADCKCARCLPALSFYHQNVRSPLFRTHFCPSALKSEWL